MVMYGGGQPETSQIGFRGNDGMKVFWDVGGHGLFDFEPLIEPGRYNFPQGAIYRLKLTKYPGPAWRGTLSHAGTRPGYSAHGGLPGPQFIRLN